MPVGKGEQRRTNEGGGRKILMNRPKLPRKGEAEKEGKRGLVRPRAHQSTLGGNMAPPQTGENA